jgi:putative ABC transport system permease protein
MSRDDGASDLGVSRLGVRDTLIVGSAGLGSRRLRTILSALGISIGIAAMVGVLGLSESSRADLRQQIQALGTNLLTASVGQGIGAGDGVFPTDAASAVRRIGPVREATATIPVDADVLRNDFVNPEATGGIDVVAADEKLLSTLNGVIATGSFIDDATGAYPNVVLGSVSAQRLGVERVDQGIQVLVGGEWFTVIGILEEFPLAPNLDRAAIIGDRIALDLLGADPNPSTVYIRTAPDAVEDVRNVLATTVDPAEPEEVEVSRPSDALEAEAAADSAFTSLFLGLGAVALLVGGIGIANVMVIAVIERRSEIGLRRALGATRAHIRRQFLTEALVLSAIGGLAGVVLGALVTAGYASSQGWDIVLPPVAMAGGFVAALVIGAVAGLYPATRAARLSPTEALRSG